MDKDQRRARQNELARKRRAEDPEKYREKERLQKAKDPDKVRQQNRDWARRSRGYPRREEVSPEEQHRRRLEWERAYREKNREKLRAYNREWHRLNPDKASAKVRKYANSERGRVRVKAIAQAAQFRRRARKAGAEGYASKEQVLARIAYFGFRCWICDGEWETVDHVKALAAGGSNWPANLRPACRPCNSSKGARRQAKFA